MYKYGMRLRGFSLGCQPEGVIKYEDVDKWKTGFWSYIWYKEPLEDEELTKYELEYIGEE